jgi:hypothetical protein
VFELMSTVVEIKQGKGGLGGVKISVGYSLQKVCLI